MFFQSIKYCSNCGKKVVFLLIEGEDRKRYYCENCKTVHYTNPKLVVGALVYFEDKILLCKRAIEPRKGFWNLPAGYLEDGESAEIGAKREVWEEAGAAVNIEGILAVYNLPQANQVYIHFYGNLVNGIYSNGVESIETRMFEVKDIPWNEMAFSSSTFAINKFLENKKLGINQSHLGCFPEV